MLEILEVSNNIFFEMIIKEDENNLSIDHLENESIELRFDELVDQVEKASFLHTDMKRTHFFTFEMITKREFNANIIDTMSLLQIDLKINEILNFVQNEN
jgi:hypothetical protein